MSTATLQLVALDRIKPSQTEGQKMRRETFDKTALQELATSIETEGVLQPVVLRPLDGGYEIVAGERRVLAARIAELEKIPATVKEYTDLEVLGVQLVENLQREGLHPMHEAESYHELKTVHNKHPDQIAADIGKSRTYVYNALKLLDLSPTARKAFYKNEISRSIAEKIARLPAKNQDEALPDITGDRYGGPMSYREVVEYLNREYMLDLTKAPFDVNDATLVEKAGPCSKCPKRTINQPELFADVKKGDLCTDSLCHATKVNAWSQRLVAAAEKDGREVIDGKTAKKIYPYANGGMREGWHQLTDEIYAGGSYRKVKTLMKKGVEPVLLVDPHGTGRVIPIVQKSQLDMPKDTRSKMPSSESQQRKKVERENKLRRAIWKELRPKLARPSDLELAHAAYNALDSDLQKILWTARGVELKKSKYGVFDRDHHEREIDKLKPAELTAFMNDCIFAPTLRVNSWGGNANAARLFEAAKKHKINVAKIKRELAPKKKPAKSKAKAARKHR